MSRKRDPPRRNLINVNRYIQIANRNRNATTIKEKYPPWLVRRIFSGKRYWEPAFWGLIQIPPRDLRAHSELFSFFAKRLIDYQLKHKKARNIEQAIAIVEKEIVEIKLRMSDIAIRVRERTPTNYARFNYPEHRIGSTGIALTTRLLILEEAIRNVKR